jgi:hypothetical protein
VQAVYPGFDSLWVDTAGKTAVDDGTATIEDSDAFQQKMENAYENSKYFSKAHLIYDEDAHIFHFDKHLTSTKGLEPTNYSDIDITPGSKYGSFVSVDKSTSNYIDSEAANCISGGDYSMHHHSTWSVEYLKDIDGRDDVWHIVHEEEVHHDFYPTYYNLVETTVGDVYFLSYDFKVNYGPDVYGGPILYQDGWKSPADDQAATREFIGDMKLGNGWVRKMFKFTITSAGSACLRMSAGYNSNKNDWYVDNIMFEKSNYPTHFTDSNRNSGTIKYELDIPQDDWTIGFWFYHNWNNTILPTSENYTKRMCQAGNYHGKDSWNIMRWHTHTKFNIWIRSTLDSYWDSSPSIVDIDDTAFKWNQIVITKLNGVMKVYLNGILKVERELAVDFENGQEYFYLGDDSASSNNGFFYDELIYIKKTIDEKTIQNWYEMDKPFVDLYPKTNTKRPSNVSITEV